MDSIDQHGLSVFPAATTCDASRPCTFCGQEISVSAKYCRFCNHEQNHESFSDTETKPCKFCAEEIKAAARICRFCDHDQEDDLPPSHHLGNSSTVEELSPGYSESTSDTEHTKDSTVDVCPKSAIICPKILIISLLVAGAILVVLNIVQFFQTNQVHPAIESPTGTAYVSKSETAEEGSMRTAQLAEQGEERSIASTESGVSGSDPDNLSQQAVKDTQQPPPNVPTYKNYWLGMTLSEFERCPPPTSNGRLLKQPHDAEDALYCSFGEMLSIANCSWSPTFYFFKRSDNYVLVAIEGTCNPDDVSTIAGAIEARYGKPSLGIWRTNYCSCKWRIAPDMTVFRPESFLTDLNEDTVEDCFWICVEKSPFCGKTGNFYPSFDRGASEEPVDVQELSRVMNGAVPAKAQIRFRKLPEMNQLISKHEQVQQNLDKEEQMAAEQHQQNIDSINSQDL